MEFFLQLEFRMPRDKAELEKLYDSGEAVVFHSKYYPGNDDILSTRTKSNSC